jgi:hypothetical protein
MDGEWETREQRDIRLAEFDEEFFERAAIMEFDGNLSRQAAEVLALHDLLGWL